MSQIPAGGLTIDERSAPSVSALQGGFAVHLDFFEGPMDLLLHLVQQREVSLSEVDLSDVCEQYLVIVSKAKFIDLERASEYLVIAATLLSMKSQSLLPSEQVLGIEDIGEGSDPAFYAALRERLKAYELTKLRAEALLNRPQLGRTAFPRPQRALQHVESETDDDTPIEVGDAIGLGTMFLQLMKRIGGTLKTMRIALEPISIVSYMMRVVDSLRIESFGTSGDRKPRQFLEMVGQVIRVDTQRRDTTRAAVLGSFLALLELMKRGIVAGVQNDDQIEVAMKFEPAPDVRYESELDGALMASHAPNLDQSSEFVSAAELEEQLSADELEAAQHQDPHRTAKVLSIDSLKERKSHDQSSEPRSHSHEASESLLAQSVK